MISLKFLRTVVLFLTTCGTSPVFALEVAGSYSGEVYWRTTDSPITINGFVSFGPDSKLHIERGVRINLAEDAQFASSGIVEINGDAGEPVVFSGGSVSVGSEYNQQHRARFGGVHVMFEHNRDVSFYDADIDMQWATSSQVLSFTMYGSRASISHSFFDSVANDALGLYDTSVVNVSSSTFIGATDAAIGIYNSALTVQASKIISGTSGLAVYSARRNVFGSAGLRVNNSVLSGQLAVYVDDRFSANQIDVRNNWWGSESGPIKIEAGDSVSDLETSIYGPARIEPWLNRDPLAPEIATIVFFLPGIEASRLYEKTPLGFENQLWEPNRNADVGTLRFASTGVPRPSDRVYTRDILDEINSFTSMAGASKNIYMSIIALFNDLVAGGYVREWVELPYDWRYSARDVSQKLLGQVVSRARGYERIVFVAHSNGGLVLRHLLDLVSEQNPLLLSFISHSYFVAVPHRGTPQAATSLLFGHNLAVLGGVLVKSSTAQLLAQTIPGAYGLLPTSSLLAQLNDTFRDTHTDFSFLSDAVLIDPLAYLGQFHASTTGIAPAEPDILGRIRGEQDQINRAVTIPVTNIVGEGLRTVYGVRYTPVDSCTNISPFVIAVVASCVPHTKLIIEPLTTRAGDGTVISKSAQLTPSMVGGVNIPEAVNAYIDLAAYNKQSFVVSRDHSSITEASPVLDEIRGYFSGVLKSDFKLATTSRYALGGGVTGTSQALMVSVHSPILIDAYDSLGRHTGRLPDSTAYELNDQFLYETTIPNSSYWEIGDSKYILLDTDDSLADSISTSTEISIIMRGVGTGLATVVLSYIDGDDIVWSKVYKDVVTVPELKIETQLDLGGVGQSTHLDSEQSTTTVSLPGGYVTMTPLSSIASTTANMVTHFATSVYCRQRESGELMVQDVKADNR